MDPRGAQVTHMILIKVGLTILAAILSDIILSLKMVEIDSDSDSVGMLTDINVFVRIPWVCLGTPGVSHSQVDNWY